MKFTARMLALSLTLFFPAALFAAGQTSPTSTTAAPAGKSLSRKEAKADCLKQDPNLKGAALKKCIHEKRMPAGK